MNANLDNYRRPIFDVTVGGRTLHVRMPSVAIYKAVAEATKQHDDPDKALEDQLLAASLVLSDNTAGVRVSVNKLQKYPHAAIMRVLLMVVTAMTKLQNDPN